MILQPRKSVTRFFIPLIDVLILLFAIFLLMPFVSSPSTADSQPGEKSPVEPTLPTDVKLLQELLREEKMRVLRLEKEKRTQLTDRLLVRLLEIDRTSGVLFYYDPDREEIRTQADAERYIFRQKALAGKDGTVKDVFFLILWPRKESAFPTVAQIDQLRQWFKDVPYGFDVP